MAIGNLPQRENVLLNNKILEQLGEDVSNPNLPYTVQAKLIYLIENLGLTGDIPDSTIQGQLTQLMEYLKPPTTCVESSLVMTGQQQLIIAAEIEGSTRKGYTIFNESTTATIYIDYVSGVSSTKKKLQLPPLYFWEPTVIYQGDIYAITSQANSTIEVRIER